ncbi:MAG: hypothetical protein AWU59_1011 [Methanolobus sp. T82-4]|nr:MAG: hypothetical protein AWU59_1011 [Methanolobus sp. T82-4]
MDTFEINDEEINVENIMDQIRENIRMRKAEGISLGCGIEGITSHSGQVYGQNADIQRDFEYINANWNIQNKSYFISSHRPIAGKVLVKGRELVHGEVQRYVDPMFWKQTELNASVARILNDNNNQFIVLDNQIDQFKNEITTKIGDQIDRLWLEFDKKADDQINQFLLEVDKKIDDRIDQLRLEFDDKMKIIESETNKKIEILESQTSQMIDTNRDFESFGVNYLQFEDTFRGSSDDIKERQSKYLSYFNGCLNVLDIGCGRGEFLLLLKEHSVGGKGVDIDDAMIEHCVSKGLDVIQKDAITYLEELDDETLDGIFIDQVVEHLEPGYLIRLLTLCAQKMKQGCYIIVETVNPLSFTSFANFYIDLTHIKPVHPATLNFLLDSCGFKERETIFISPVPKDNQLKTIQLNDEADFEVKEIMEVYNNNIEMLNTKLYGAQDFAIIGKK